MFLSQRVEVPHRSCWAVHREVRGPVRELSHTPPWSAMSPHLAQSDWFAQVAFFAVWPDADYEANAQIDALLYLACHATAWAP